MTKSLVRNMIRRTRTTEGAGPLRLVRARWRRVRTLAEAGMSTAEYAVGTLAAVTFATVLIAVVKSEAVKGALSGIIQSALSIAG